MNKDNIIVDMKNPTPIDLYRYSSKGVVDILFYKGNSSGYSLEIHDSSSKEPLILEDCSSSMLKTWKVIEIFRSKAFKENKIVNVHDKDTNAKYKKLSLANTLYQQDVEETIENQAKASARFRRKMVVENKYHSRRTKKIDPRLIRPILREEKTW